MDANNYTGPIKRGYFKFRELAHTQDQATILASLKAVEENKVAANKKAFNKKEKTYVLLDWIKANPGREIKTNALATILGFRAGSTAWRFTEYLVAGNKIRWVGNKKGRYLEIVDPASKLPKGDSRNGPVFVKKLEPLEPVVWSKDGEPVTQRTPRPASADQVIVDQLNALVWRYLKEVGSPAEVPANNHTTLSTGLVQTLVDFTTWVDKLSGNR